MRLALVLLVACSAPGPVAPQVAAQLHLIGCEPAVPLPRTATEGLIGVVSPSEYTPFSNNLTVPHPVPSVGGGTPTISGMVDKSIVLRVIKAHTGQLRACYERELAISPGTNGKVTVTFTVGPDGKVNSTRAIAVDVSAALSACVVRVVQQFQFPTGMTMTITYPFTFSTTGEPGVAPRESTPVWRAKTPWTPFALDDAPALDTARRVARATEGAVRGRLAQVAACFDATAPSGSLRAMLAVGGEGSIGAVRAGGLGDTAREACVGKALLDLHVLSPVHDSAEVACDFSRGDARPWRIAPDAGYSVIEVTGRKLQHAGDTIEPQQTAPPPLPGDQTFLVVAEPETSGEVIEVAIQWARQGDATLLAIKQDRGPPVLVGSARTDRQVGGTEAAQVWSTLSLGRGKVTACLDEGKRGSKPAVREAAIDGVDDLVHRIAARCKSVRCGSSLGVVIEPDARLRELGDVAAAARRAGFDRVLLGADFGCAQTQRRR